MKPTKNGREDPNSDSSLTMALERIIQARKREPEAPEESSGLDEWAFRDAVIFAQTMKGGLKRLIDIFRSADTDRSGELSLAEFGTALIRMGFEKATKREIRHVFSVCDVDRGGTVRYDEVRPATEPKEAPAVLPLMLQCASRGRDSSTSSSRVSGSGPLLPKRKAHVVTGSALPVLQELP
jgi:hypothetical protein